MFQPMFWSPSPCRSQCFDSPHVTDNVLIPQCSSQCFDPPHVPVNVLIPIPMTQPMFWLPPCPSQCFDSPHVPANVLTPCHVFDPPSLDPTNVLTPSYFFDPPSHDPTNVLTPSHVLILPPMTQPMFWPPSPFPSQCFDPNRPGIYCSFFLHLRHYQPKAMHFLFPKGYIYYYQLHVTKWQLLHCIMYKKLYLLTLQCPVNYNMQLQHIRSGCIQNTSCYTFTKKKGLIIKLSFTHDIFQAIKSSIFNMNIVFPDISIFKKWHIYRFF